MVGVVGVGVVAVVAVAVAVAAVVILGEDDKGWHCKT